MRGRVLGIELTVLGLAVLILLNMGLACPAQAQDKDVKPGLKNYVILRGGAVWPMDNDLNNGATASSTVSYNLGFGASAAYGYRILPFLRGEVEVGYMRAQNDKLTQNARGTKVDDEGYEEHIYAMLNAYLDLPNKSDFTPFIGAGIGYSHVTMKNKWWHIRSASMVERGDSDGALAYQFMAGASWAFRPEWLVELRGRYFGTTNREHANHSLATIQTVGTEATKIWTVELGIRYCF